jgi:hypothetical protein
VFVSVQRSVLRGLVGMLGVACLGLERRDAVERRMVLVVLALLCTLAAGALALFAAPVALAGEHCENEASRQGPSVNLPQCRVYEQVTPVDKGGAQDMFPVKEEVEPAYRLGPLMDPGHSAWVAEEGNAILIQTDSSFGSSTPTAAASAYVFSRGAEGWRKSVLAQPSNVPQEVEEVRLLNPRDLSEVAFEDEIGTFGELLGGDQSAFQRAQLVGPAGGPFTSLYTASGFAAFQEINVIGGSEDLSNVILESENHSLAPGAEGQDEGTTALYESTGGAECAPLTSNCKLVDVNGEGKTMQCGASLGQGRGGGGGAADAYGAVSSDGSLVFFTAPDPGTGHHPEGPGCWGGGAAPQVNPPELYMREGGRTVEISVPEVGSGVEVGTVENPLLGAAFVGASSDGSKVFFMTKTELTKGAVGHAPELYEYETASGKLTLISGGKSGTLEGDVNSVTAVSRDGSTVYFTAFKRLTENAKEDRREGGNKGYEGPSIAPINLYRYDTLTGATTYVTTVTEGGYPLEVASSPSHWYTEEFGGEGAGAEGLASETEWYTTGDGRFLVFGTVLPLTGFDNKEAPGGECPVSYAEPKNGYKRCVELYRYDAEAERYGEPSIVCVSCAGGAPIDDAYFDRNGLTYGSSSTGPPRPISEDGEDVFFDSANALVSQAVPGRTHVYEWHDDVISLISSPSDPGDAFFLGSSETGRDVFFVTHAQLSAQDTDQSADVYDARVDGGFEGITPSQCTGTGCQGLPAAPPIFATPASATFEGVGNFPASEPAVKPASKPKAKPKRCGRGSVKKHGRCVVKMKAKKAKHSAKGRK